jgi:DNA mismatch repair ATPase MutS
MLDIKKRVNKNQQLKYKQYGYHDSGQTKESRVDFDTLISSLNKINTDLKSLSITVEKLKHNRESSHGTLGELRDFLNHVTDAKKQLKSISFQTFIPSEIDQVKAVYETIEQFLESINAYVDFDLVKETQTKEDLNIELDRLKQEYEIVKKGKPRTDSEKEKKEKTGTS